MKNRILLSIMLLLACFSMAKAEVVQVGNGGYSTPELPANVGYCYSRTYQIFTASEIGRGGTISSISFCTANAGQFNRNMTIYLQHIDLSSFPDQNYSVNLSNMVKVFEGEVTFYSMTWSAITFDTPFEYNGTSNLILVVDDHTGAYLQDEISFVANKATHQSIYRRSDYSNDLGDGYFSGYRNTIKLEFDDTIGSGEGTNDYLPTYTFYNYSLSQQIYSKDELKYVTPSITSVSFFNTSSEVTRNLDIYLIPTNILHFLSGSMWLNFTEADKVFTGDVTFKKGEWTPISFNVRAFPYDGTSNVALIVVDNTGTYQAPSSFLAFHGTSQSIWISKDETKLTADGLGGYQGEVQNVKNQVRFNEVGLDTKPYNLTANDITYRGATITWNSAGTKWNMDYKTAASDTWYHAVDPSNYSQTLTSPTFNLIGLDEETTFDIRVRTINDDGSYSDYVFTQFTTPQRFPRPTDVKVLAVTSFSAMLDWTENGTATKWRIYLNDTPVCDTDTKPHILTGLRQGYSYSVVVRPIIVMDDDDEPYYGNRSEAVVFFTPLVNSKPVVTSVTPTPNSATITWEGESDSYVVRYRSVATEEETIFCDGFESGDLTTNGWTTIRNKEGTSATDWQVVTGYHHNGSYAAASYCRDYNGTLYNISNTLLTPFLLMGEKLEFWARNAGNTAWLDEFEVRILPKSDISQYVLRPLQTSSTSWEKITVDLSEYKGMMAKILFCHKDEMKSVLAIDDVIIYNPAKEASEWQTIETTDKTVTIEGLEADTEYEFEVVGIMQREEDASSGVETFMTLEKNPAPFDVVVKPTATTAHISWKGYGDKYTVVCIEVLSESKQRTFFDNFEYGFDDQGWTVYTDGQTLPDNEEGWYVTSTGSSMAACSNSYYLASDYSDVALNADNWLITPQVDLGGTLKYREWVRGDYPESYEVLLSTTGKAKENFTIVLRSLSPGEGAGSGNSSIWSDVELDMSAYEGQMGYIAIHHKCSDKFWMYIDDFAIYRDVREYGELYTKTVREMECTMQDLKPETRYRCAVHSIGYGDPPLTEFNFMTLNEPIDLVLDDNSDNTSILKAKEGAYVNATINNRTFRKDGTWQGICLPFDLDVENSILAGADVRTLESTTQYENYIILNCLTPVMEMKAGTPYVIKWNGGADIVNPVFEGVVIDLADRDILLDGYGLGAFSRNAGSSSSVVYSSFECQTNQEYIQLMNGTPMLTPVTADAGLTIHAFDIMFSVQYLYTDEAIVLLNTGEYNDMITGIKTTDNSQQTTEIYNLAGMRLNKVQKGINIVNGKKVLVK